ncbi:hypothetical protein FRC10_002983 [Ceratobasidium sp. 414]|nr:hypothetical protein FRC10_002983 [Ceratobasidium sp. 414]
MNSDFGFNLYNHLISAAIDAIEPFPRGLLTDTGQLVANPVYDPNHTKSEELAREAYHGTVSWSLFALGETRGRGVSQSEFIRIVEGWAAKAGLVR